MKTDQQINAERLEKMRTGEFNEKAGLLQGNAYVMRETIQDLLDNPDSEIHRIMAENTLIRSEYIKTYTDEREIKSKVSAAESVEMYRTLADGSRKDTNTGYVYESCSTDIDDCPKGIGEY